MADVIDLMSSDDDGVKIEKTINAVEFVSVPSLVLEKSTNDHETKNLTTQNDSTNPGLPEDKITTEQTVTNATVSIQLNQRARRRKSQHQTLRTSPEIEFESLSPKKKSTNRSNPKPANRNSVLKKNTKKISILGSKPLTCEQLLNNEFDRFLRDDATLNLMREISAERVRINELLSLHVMPEIKFSLYTKREMLEFQLTERFKQKEMLQKSLSDIKSTTN